MDAEQRGPVLDLRAEPYDGPAAQEMTSAVQQEYVERYGVPDVGPVHAEELQPPRGAFFIGYVGDDPVAMGGLRRIEHSGTGSIVELKRMYVAPRWRGRGLSRQLLAALEAAAEQIGATRVILETGQRQPEALALYRSSGYQPIEAFGYYSESPLSVCLAKDLPPASCQPHPSL